eukprot:m51a1_g1066 putative adenylate guanylate cyclase (1736) ;mRNA; r:837566-843104
MSAPPAAQQQQEQQEAAQQAAEGGVWDEAQGSVLGAAASSVVTSDATTVWTDASSTTTSAARAGYSVLQQAAFAANAHRGLRGLRPAAAALVCAQLLSLPLEQTAAVAPGSLAAAARWLAIVRAPALDGGANRAAAAAGLAFGLLAAALGAWNVWRCWRATRVAVGSVAASGGAVARPARAMAAWRLCLDALPALVFPIAFWAFCELADAADTAGLAIGAVALLLLVANAAFASFFVGEFMPHCGALATMHPRLQVVLAGAQLALSATRAWMPHARSWGHALASLLCALALLGALWHLLPFWRKLSNCAAGALASALSAAAAAQLAGSLLRGASVLPFAVACAVLVPAGAAGFVALLLRQRAMERIVTDPIPERGLAFKGPAHVLHGVKRAFGARGQEAATLLPRALEALECAQQDYAHEAWLPLMRALVLVEVACDPAAALQHLRTARRLRTAPDTEFLIASALQGALGTVAREQAREEVQVELAGARKEHERCKASCVRFWQTLGRSQADTLDVEELLRLARSAAQHEAKARDVLQSVIRDNPYSVAALRAYAKHLSELKNDSEGADQALIVADQLEEDQHRLQKKQERRMQRRHSPRTMASSKKTVRRTKVAIVVSGAADSDAGDTGDAGDAPEASGAAKAAAEEEEKASESGGSYKSAASLISAGSAGTAQAERAARMRTARRKIEGAGSTTAGAMRGLMLATVTACVCGTAMMYASTAASMDTFQSTLIDMSRSVTTRLRSTEAALYLRAYQHAQLNATAAAPRGDCAMVAAKAELFQESINSMFVKSGADPSIAAFWAQPSVSLRRYVALDYANFSRGFYNTRVMPLWDAGCMLLNAFRVACNLSAPAGQLETRLDFRFAVENSVTVFVTELRTLATLYRDLSHDKAARIKYFLYGFFPAAMAIGFIFGVVLYVPIVLKMRRERTRAVRMFLELPKSAVINTLERLTAGGAGGGGGARDDGWLRAKGHVTPLMRLNAAYVVTCLVAVAACIVIFALALWFSTANANDGVTLAAAGARVSSVAQLLFWAQELVVGDSTMWTRAQLVALFDRSFQRFITADRTLKYGNSSLGVRSLIVSDAHLYELWYQRPCPPSVPVANCRGLSTFLRFYVDGLQNFANSFRELVNSTEMPDAEAMQQYYEEPYAQRDTLTEWLLEDLQYLEDAHQKDQRAVEDAIVGVFAACVPLVVVLFVAANYVLHSVAADVAHVYKMMLFVPHTVLLSVPAVAETFALADGPGADGGSGAGGGTEEERERDQQRLTKSVVDACEDIVILCNQSRVIELFNPVAEAITGYTADQVLRRDVGVVIPADVGANAALLDEIFGDSDAARAKRLTAAEVVLRTRAGALFHSLISVSKSVVHGRVTSALFIRDITAIKEHQKELSHERERAEGLLLNIFPRQIADQLNAMAEQTEEGAGGVVVAEGPRGAAGAGGRAAMMASQFAEVAVVFANIAGFTALTEAMSAERVLQLLNDVFSVWDNMLDEFGVEKIKTIGNAYMAACGVPAPVADPADRAMRFSVALLGTLAARNAAAEVPLALRVGVNAGPVVAGIIGTRKIAYDLWGDTVNVASRMEHAGPPGCVQVNEETHRRLHDRYSFECRGLLAIQGKGDMVCYAHRPSPDALANWRDERAVHDAAATAPQPPRPPTPTDHRERSQRSFVLSGSYRSSGETGSRGVAAAAAAAAAAGASVASETSQQSLRGAGEGELGRRPAVLSKRSVASVESVTRLLH